MTVISPDAAPRFDALGVRFIGLAAPSRGSRENSVWRIIMRPGAPANVHRLSREEVLVAIQGSARVTLAGREMTLHAGGAVIVPRDTDFSLSNPGDEPFEAVAVLPVGGEAMIPGVEPFIPPWAA